MNDASLEEFCRRMERRSVIHNVKFLIFTAGTAQGYIHAKNVHPDPDAVLEEMQYLPLLDDPESLARIMVQANESLKTIYEWSGIDNSGLCAHTTELPSATRVYGAFMNDPDMFVDNGYSTRPAVVAAAARHGWDMVQVAELGRFEQFRADMTDTHVVALIIDGRCYRRLPNRYFAEWEWDTPNPKSAVIRK